MKKISSGLLFIALVVLGAYIFYFKAQWENRLLKQVIERLEADSRIAEVVVSDVTVDENAKELTTIKFVEYSAGGQPLEPKFFTFHGNLIQFQTLVIRFDDLKIRNADVLKGKSAYLFWKVFRLAGAETEEYMLTQVEEIPQGYRVSEGKNLFERTLWKQFWDYALDPTKAKSDDVKNAQVEAPGTRFLPGYLYTLTIEHDGGLRIDAEPSAVLP